MSEPVRNIDTEAWVNLKEFPVSARWEISPPTEIDALRAERDAAVAERDRWKSAIIDAAVVGWTYREEHEDDPRAAVNALLCHAADVDRDRLLAALRPFGKYYVPEEAYRAAAALVAEMDAAKNGGAT